jgi:signal transduction histidine kinase
VPAKLSEAHKIIGEFRKHITEVIDNVHRLSHDLIPPILENLGLSDAVKSLLERFTIYQAAEVMMEIDDLKGLFPREAEINLFRLFQEFLNNIIKHANATQIKVIISRHPNCVDFRLEDNGKGFDPKTVLDYKNPGRGMGLVTMEERVHMLGGVLKLQSEPGQGTRIHFAVPVANPKKGASPLTSILT